MWIIKKYCIFAMLSIYLLQAGLLPSVALWAFLCPKRYAVRGVQPCAVSETTASLQRKDLAAGSGRRFFSVHVLKNYVIC
jgi:hypothetical protein